MQLDKLTHFLVGAVITLAVGYIAPIMTACVVAILIGWCKEVYDYYHSDTHTADMWDFVATAWGGLAASLFILATTMM